MSFALTTAQVLARTKTVTRRTGWTFLQPHDRIRAVRKAMGLRKGEKIEPLAVLRVVDVRQEPLNRMTDDVYYGREECKLEGFPDHGELMFPTGFVKFFCATHRCEPNTVVTRIAFAYEEPAPAGFEWRAGFSDARPCDQLVLGRRVVATVWGTGRNFVWSTWDDDGVGGENGGDPTLEVAQREVYAALARQVKRDPGRWWPIEVPS